MPSSKARNLADLLGGGGAGVPSFSGTGAIDVPAGTTAERPSNPNTGYVRYNTTIDQLEQYTETFGWQGISAPPSITGTTPSALDSTASTQNLSVEGSNFDSGATVTLKTSSGQTIVPTTSTRVSSSQINITLTGATAVDADTPEPLDVIVTNGSGLATTYAGGVGIDDSPEWVTAANSTLATLLEDQSTSGITVSATDPETGGSIVYEVSTGSTLPNGLSLDLSGEISGTINEGTSGYSQSGVQHSFSIDAVGSDGDRTPRTFNILRKWRDGSTSALAIAHPDDAAALGLGNGDYYISDFAGQTLLLPCEMNKSNGLNFVRLDHTTFKNVLGVPSFDCSVGVTWAGWSNYNGREYLRSYPNSNDYEVWNNFSLGNFAFRYIGGEVTWASMSGTTVGSGHPDNQQYDNYRDNDTDYNSLGYNGQGGGNKSWWRFGVGGVFQLAWTELGPDGEMRDTYSTVTIGNKTGNFPSGISRVTGAMNYIDMGSKRTAPIRFSTFSESGAPPAERIAWSPYQIYVS